MESEASTLHNISIPALGIDKDIPPNGKVQFDVTFPAWGVLAFFCKFHGPLGMNAPCCPRARETPMNSARTGTISASDLYRH